MPITIGGKTYTVPDVYGTLEVQNLSGVAIPTFNGLLIMGNAKKGQPYVSTLKGQDVIKAFSDQVEVNNEYGATSDIAKAFQQAKLGGAGVVYCLNVSPLTAGGGSVISSAALDPLMTLSPRGYGAHVNDIRVAITVSTSTTITIKPTKNTKYFTANLGTTATVITLAAEDMEGIRIGDKWMIRANSVAPEEVTITGISGNSVTISASPASALNTSAFARMYQYDTDNIEQKTFSTYTVAEVCAWINSGKILTAVQTGSGIIPATAEANLFTGGTSPVATTSASGDWDTVGAALPRLFEEFSNYTRARIRILNLLTSVAGVHASYKSVLAALRTMQYSCVVVTGVDSGDIVLASNEANNPVTRAKALNSDEIILCGMGIDGKAAYISLAPQIAGIMTANSVKRNLTFDSISASSVEKTFGEFNKETELKTHIDNGVLVLRTGANGFFVAQGVNTYQYHDQLWNSSEKKTYLIQQRQIADYAYEVFKRTFAEGVGEDDVTPDFLARRGNDAIDTMIEAGYIQEGQVQQSNKIGNAIYLFPMIKPTVGTDFVGFTLKVQVP